ncbi:hypothetical protein HNR39_004512 [Glaciimonas immobilis]|uniref:Uncharacterized protein n=1 Tax=Glaciimonas immobilis TaxID=728004 RepID=A0A840RZI7_9BURK|nr:hypothetical protein [Glaciimonas immobilis]
MVYYKPFAYFLFGDAANIKFKDVNGVSTTWARFGWSGWSIAKMVSAPWMLAGSGPAASYFFLLG